ncbi:hypothetical protein PC116_g7438 [Phytophthora cactorum]|uniref:Uncharacterized protein n=1 Tax=Phytophthora cactorum TaxID=29920 RepID=A0A8T1LCJ0_9STRA|nr:hypothetical protein PC117_g8066 [Phytophthora cactorum]KAG3182831.1 hypothetical protein C6341_g5760 [Phytophthora cactorum]KAG3188321.1 hypothetical protein PC128_g12234 [Phytophthora cactorum]KAG4244731.1 hypothetical protein PC116_g7438 [Phytophthora cactorum]
MAEPLKYPSEGVSSNGIGMDWQQYKWAIEVIFKKKKRTDSMEGRITRSTLTSSESE